MNKLLLALFLTIGVLKAEDIYVSQNGAGSQSGASAANAHSMTWFNTGSNWSTAVAADGKIGPGDILHFTGTITSVANIQGSGIAGNRITLRIDPGAKFSAPVWPDTGGIAASNQSHITVEGSNPQAGDGIVVQTDIENTNVGTLLGSQAFSRLVCFQGNGSNITVQNMAVRNVFQRPFAHPTDTSGSGTGVRIEGNDNLLIENCYFDNAETGCNIVANNVDGINTGLVINNNWITDCANGVKISTAANAILQSGRITRNRIDHLDRWSTTSGDYHLDGIQTIGDAAGSSIRDLHIAYNHIGPHLDIPNSASMTASIFCQYGVTGAKVYNNFIEIADNVHQTNDTITVGNRPIEQGLSYGERHLIANNTIVTGVGGSGEKGIHGGYSEIVGNVIQGVEIYIHIHNVDTGNPLWNTIVNRNVYFGSPEPGDCFWIEGGSPSGFPDFSTWQSLGFDAQGVVSNPLLNSNGTLQTGSPAIGRAPTQTIFNDDFNGNPRTGAWSAGAFQFATGGPVAPTVSSSTINAAGTQVAVVFNEAVKITTAGGFSLSSSGGAVTLGSPSVAGSTITWPITNRLIAAGETVTRTYVQPGNGIEAVDDSTDVASFTAIAVTNSSTVAGAATPVFSPTPGGYSSTQNVTMTSSTPGATIRYTTNGTDPTASSTLYTGPISTSLTTTYKAKAFATGFLDSPIATGAYQIGDFVLTTAWTNIAVTSQTGSFTWTFRATPSAVGVDAVVALADHNAAAFTDLAVIPRFNAAGVIDAINGGTYAAVNNFPYVAGQAYDFVVTVNLTNHTYSMTVVQAGGSTPTTIATNYGFRTQQATVNHLDVFSGITSLGTVTVSNMVFTPAAPTLSLTGIATNAAGTQVTATFNSQPSFGVGGQGGFTLSASGGAVTASNTNIGTNSITWQTLSRTIGFGESITATYVQPGNGIEAASGGADLASFSAQSVLNNATVDLTPPTPNPSTFGIAPTATSATSITMTATTSTDARSGPVQYFFNETSGNAGGSDSGWQSSPTFTDTGLAAGTQYSYRVMTRDSAPTPNMTTFSATFSATTRSVAGAHAPTPFKVARANIVTP